MVEILHCPGHKFRDLTYGKDRITEADRGKKVCINCGLKLRADHPHAIEYLSNKPC